EKKKPIFYALDEINSKVLGYILGDTKWDESYHGLFPFYEEARFKLLDYPAHLHINCHPEAQGMGVGSKLLAYYENYLKSLDIKGLHLVTAEEADNVKFYRKNNYLSIYETNWKQINLVFLGKTLEA